MNLCMRILASVWLDRPSTWMWQAVVLLMVRISLLTGLLMRLERNLICMPGIGNLKLLKNSDLELLGAALSVVPCRAVLQYRRQGRFVGPAIRLSSRS